MSPSVAQTSWRNDGAAKRHMDAGGVLHTRLLKLGNDSGVLEMLDGGGVDLEALTEGAGPHPLFNGVERVVIGGLGAKPSVRRDGTNVMLAEEGLTVAFDPADYAVEGRTLVIRLK